MSLSDVRIICLETLLYIDGIFTVPVIPFILCAVYNVYITANTKINIKWL